MPRIVLSLAAERNLADLFEWIAQDSGLDRAEAVLDRLQGAMTNLAALPGLGRARHELEGAPRSFALWPWIIFYEALPEEDGVIIWRVLDGCRDLPTVY
jgi:toxin ParE1/3/4